MGTSRRLQEFGWPNMANPVKKSTLTNILQLILYQNFFHSYLYFPSINNLITKFVAIIYHYVEELISSHLFCKCNLVKLELTIVSPTLINDLKIDI